jgi:RHS repeat-associated protein
VHQSLLVLLCLFSNPWSTAFRDDVLARCVRVQDPAGNVEIRQVDLLGRAVRVQEPDGNLRELRDDGEGNVVRAKDQQYDVEFNYTGVNRLLSRTQAGTTVCFVYDTEENLTAIYNEAGAVYRFVLGPTEIERHLPGGVRSVWRRDKLGRPLNHEIWSGQKLVGAKSYSWEPNDRLKMIVDALAGPVQFSHDGLGNLTAAAYPDGKVDLRMPDAVGNLFRTNERRDRKYGSAGQLLESWSQDGVTRYAYDAEGNLGKKLLPDGREWTYAWNAAGMLAKVVRPDGKVVEFGYDALGRRVWKKYQGKTTKWIWDGNVPVHEWVELDPGVAETPAPERIAEAEDAGLRQRAVDLAKRAAQGPPDTRNDRGSAIRPITWVFEPESFAPAAKLVGGQQHAIITDHLGTPTAMLDADGRAVWSADIGIYGDLRNVTGDKQACPFRWPGQYEDEETGLYYNRFRYYDPESGEYVSQDPIGLAGGPLPYGFVADPLFWFDPLGLAGCKGAIVLGQNMPDRVRPAATALGAGWLKGGKKGWSWEKNRKFINRNVQKVKAGTGRILDIGFERGRYHGSNAIYSKETAVLKRAGLHRVDTGQRIIASNGRIFRVHEWLP